MKKYAYGLAAAIVAGLFLVVGAMGFTAANAAPAVKANEFCKKTDLGKIVGNLRCEKDGPYYRWKPYTPPVSSSSKSASTSSSASASASPSASATSSASASSSTSTTPPPNSASSTQLPLTGTKPWLLAATGAVLVAAGALMFLILRRRIRFTAQ